MINLAMYISLAALFAAMLFGDIFDVVLVMFVGSTSLFVLIAIRVAAILISDWRRNNVR